MSLYDNVLRSADYIRSQTNLNPTIGVVLGSGLSAVVDGMQDKVVIPFTSIPFFPPVGVKGQEGNLVIGTFHGKTIVAMQGRYHYYEGYTMQQVAYPVYVFKALGVQKLVLTNACGAVNASFQPGDLMFITDYINLLGINPLIGENDERFGVRFPDMSEPYSPNLIAQAEAVATQNGIACQKGVYGYFNGPCFESAAEIRAYRVMGADVVGMSTVPETIVANYLGMQVMGISCITNMATGLAKNRHSHDEVLRIANLTGEKLATVLMGWLSVTD